MTEPEEIYIPNPLADSLAIAQQLVDQILNSSEDILGSKVALSIGVGMLMAGTTRYTMMHPELIEKSIEQIGQSLEIGGSQASGLGSEALTALAPLLAAGATALGGLATATVIPGVPPPP